MKACRGRRDMAPLTLNLGRRWWCVVTSRPGRFTPERDTGFPLNRRLGGAQSLCGLLENRKLFPVPEYEHRTAQPVGLRHSDCCFSAKTSSNSHPVVNFMSVRVYKVLIPILDFIEALFCSRPGGRHSGNLHGTDWEARPNAFCGFFSLLYQFICFFWLCFYCCGVYVHCHT
jgi:hypothetical protein